MGNTHLVDLAERLPTDLLALIGELTVLFGRLEHMVLLALKRKRDISLAIAMEEYKTHTLGAKLNGKQPCKSAGANCQNYNSAPGLLSFSDYMPDLKKLGQRIQTVTENRNRFLNGLITTVEDEAVLIHKKKIFGVKANELDSLRTEVIGLISELNAIIPVPGVHAEVVTGLDLDIRYDVTAMASTDPIVIMLGEKPDA